MKQKFTVTGMSCASCKIHVENAVKSLPGVENVNVNLIQNNMDVEYSDNVTINDIEKAVKNAGYNAFPYEKQAKTNNKKDVELIRLISAFVILIVLMYVSMGHMMFNFPVPSFINMHTNPIGFASIQLVLVIPIAIIYNRYFVRGYKLLFKGSPNMDSLIGIGATFSILYGIFALIMIIYGVKTNNNDIVELYHMNLYFESAAMILTLVSLGKYLESLSKKKTTKAIEKLVDLSPKRAIVLKDGEEVEINADDVKKDDIVVVKKGMLVPVDGLIIEGKASIDQSNITGESIPVYKTIDDSVYSSTTITTGYIKVKAVKVKDDTSISNIIRLVEEASNSKAPISKLADKISGVFVPIILCLSVLTFIVNLFVSKFNFELSLNFAITVVVIACPCALGLATPVAIMVGCGKGAENGLLIKNAEILEKAQFIKTIVLDKTGTITKGKPEVCDFINYSNNDLLDIAYSIESKSEHPLALSIINYAKENNANLYEVNNYSTLDGYGISGDINNNTYYIGNIKWAKELTLLNDDIINKVNDLSKQGKTTLLIMNKEKVMGLISIKDEVRKNSIYAIKCLKNLGIKVIMLTGDNKLTATSIANEVGVDEVISEVLPTDKKDVIEKLKTDDKHLVAMVGDGVNDALALTVADLGIAIGGGSDVAIETSDIVLIKNSLLDVVNVINLSKKVLRTIKLNLFWAFFYNSICVVLATGFLYYINGFRISPMYGSIAMSISSVTVVLNALTINLFKPKKEIDDSVITLKVKGMMCENCEHHVMEACMESNNVINAKADHEKGIVTIYTNGEVDIEDIKRKINESGYKA